MSSREPRDREIMSDVLVFAPMHNTKGRKDATGAFIPESENFCKVNKIPLENRHLIDNQQSPAWMRRKVFEIIASWGFDEQSYALYPGECRVLPLRAVAFFCHGFKTGIQFGFRIPDVDGLAKAIASQRTFCEENFEPIVALYCCSTGRDRDRDQKDDMQNFGGDGGFADELRDALCRAGCIDCRVLAHTTAGHTTKNPDVREFCGYGRYLGGEGGSYIIPRKHSEEFRVWRRSLQDITMSNGKIRRTKLRYQFPFLSTSKIQDTLNFR